MSYYLSKTPDLRRLVDARKMAFNITLGVPFVSFNLKMLEYGFSG